MAAAAKPVSLTSAATNPDVHGDPQPFLLVIPGYKASVAQTLQHDASGVIKWVDNA